MKIETTEISSVSVQADGSLLFKGWTIDMEGGGPVSFDDVSHEILLFLLRRHREKEARATALVGKE